MYIPASFVETDPNKLFSAMEQYSFATVISGAGSEMTANHFPFLLQRDAGPHGTLLGHMARANPQWRSADGQPVLVIFQGPHAYISPTWYESQQVVPTWNYVAVHAYGTFHVDQDPGRVLQRVRETVDLYETHEAHPWSMDTQDPVFIDRLLQAIVNFEIKLERLEGKWKLNQNHPPDRRAKVVQALRERGDENARAMADLMVAPD